MSRIRWRGLAGAALLAGGAMLLAGCVTVNITPDGSAEASSSAPAPGSTQTASDQMPGFETIDGAWCPADGSAECIEIALPHVLDASGSATESVAEATVTGDSAPCYASAFADLESGMAQVAVFYCPAGEVIATGIIAEHDDTAYDRLYFTQNPPYADVWFREDSLALGRGD